jgi:hypothetical protein
MASSWKASPCSPSRGPRRNARTLQRVERSAAKALQFGFVDIEALFAGEAVAPEQEDARFMLGHLAELGTDGKRIAHVFEQVRADAELEELVRKRPRRLARVMAEPGVRAVARRLLGSSASRVLRVS